MAEAVSIAIEMQRSDEACTVSSKRMYIPLNLGHKGFYLISYQTIASTEW